MGLRVIDAWIAYLILCNIRRGRCGWRVGGLDLIEGRTRDEPAGAATTAGKVANPAETVRWRFASQMLRWVICESLICYT